MINTVKNEIKATWAGGLPFDFGASFADTVAAFDQLDPSAKEDYYRQHEEQRPMAKLETLRIDLGPMVREAMIESLSDLIDAIPQYRFAVILELLKRDPISRMMLAEAMGEAAVREEKADEEAEAVLVSSDFTADDDRRDLSWDELMLEVLAELSDTPGGRAEVPECD